MYSQHNNTQITCWVGFYVCLFYFAIVRAKRFHGCIYRSNIIGEWHTCFIHIIYPFAWDTFEKRKDLRSSRKYDLSRRDVILGTREKKIVEC